MFSELQPVAGLMDRPDQDIDDASVGFVEASARLLGLAIAPEWLDDIRFNMLTLEKASALVFAYPLEDEAEAAPVFRA